VFFLLLPQIHIQQRTHPVQKIAPPISAPNTIPTIAPVDL
jgi:hypothetical protein